MFYWINEKINCFFFHKYTSENLILLFLKYYSFKFESWLFQLKLQLLNKATHHLNSIFFVFKLHVVDYAQHNIIHATARHFGLKSKVVRSTLNLKSYHCHYRYRYHYRYHDRKLNSIITVTVTTQLPFLDQPCPTLPNVTKRYHPWFL